MEMASGCAERWAVEKRAAAVASAAEVWAEAVVASAAEDWAEAKKWSEAVVASAAKKWSEAVVASAAEKWAEVVASAAAKWPEAARVARGWLAAWVVGICPHTPL